MHHVDPGLLVIWHLELVTVAVDFEQLLPVRDHDRLHCLPTNARSAQYEAAVGNQETVVNL